MEEKHTIQRNKRYTSKSESFVTGLRLNLPIFQSSNLPIFQFYIFEPVKKVIAIVFLLLLCTQYIFKLGIITYFEANREYIAEVLCVNKAEPITMCYGQCFLD